ncbi:hypothetical protein ACFVZC_13445 [Streptomyces marokkonensis]|uniref:Uncharacterized protein n=1 Tax=Streptomyces marokkonensis TaxID=324855 RepID=A0ABW6Q5C2_9ACTN
MTTGVVITGLNFFVMPGGIFVTVTGILCLIGAVAAVVGVERRSRVAADGAEAAPVAVAAG